MGVTAALMGPMLPWKGPRIGKSAGGEMHLSATVYCKQCDMWVELGTKDCPHSIELSRDSAKK